MNHLFKAHFLKRVWNHSSGTHFFSSRPSNRHHHRPTHTHTHDESHVPRSPQSQSKSHHQVTHTQSISQLLQTPKTITPRTHTPSVWSRLVRSRFLPLQSVRWLHRVVDGVALAHEDPNAGQVDVQIGVVRDGHAVVKGTNAKALLPVPEQREKRERVSVMGHSIERERQIERPSPPPPPPPA